MAPPGRAQWGTTRAQVVSKADAAGVFALSAPVYDNGVKAATVTVTITPDRKYRLLVELEPGSTMSGFDAWAIGEDI